MNDLTTTLSQAIPSDVLESVLQARPFSWHNTRHENASLSIPHSGLPLSEVAAARERLRRFAPLIRSLFPSTAAMGGIIESPLRVLSPQFQAMLAPQDGEESPQPSLLMKLDSEMPVSGSIKARGGIHETLAIAEDIARQEGLLPADDDYLSLASRRVREAFSRDQIIVGSTGNLGLSVGVMAAALGFHAIVHMSSDAREWKKRKLRENGVTVVEHEGDYSLAVEAGRQEAESNPHAHFIDDERSSHLFFGYATAARRLAGQLQTLEIDVDNDHPLVLVLPCGVGGAPGGITFGMKALFGDAARCVFVEPVQAPSMFLGVASGLCEAARVEDVGLTGRTSADGLAVSRPSILVSHALSTMIDGFATVSDDDLLSRAFQLHDSEGIFVEPSAAAGLAAYPGLAIAAGLTPVQFAHSTVVLWATGGGMVPQAERREFLEAGRQISLRSTRPRQS